MNNKLEYEALLKKISIASALEVKKVEVKEYSKIIVKQISGQYVAKGEKLKKKYLQ